jgi:sugar lactone lactonase YvrE
MEPHMAFDDIKVAFGQQMQVGECPLWHHGEDKLYWVDIDGFTVHRLDPASGEHASWRMDSEPSALAIHAGGGLVVALRSGLVHLDTNNGEVTPIAAAPYDTGTARFNDGRVDPAGRFWVGTRYEKAGQGATMFCLDRGQVRTQWSGGMTNSNGLGFSPDGRTMYHADTTAHRIDRYDFDAATGPPARSSSNSRPTKQRQATADARTAPRWTATVTTGARCSKAAACCALHRPANYCAKCRCRCAARPWWRLAAPT